VAAWQCSLAVNLAQRRLRREHLRIISHSHTASVATASGCGSATATASVSRSGSGSGSVSLRQWQWQWHCGVVVRPQPRHLGLLALGRVLGGVGGQRAVGVQPGSGSGGSGSGGSGSTGGSGCVAVKSSDSAWQCGHFEVRYIIDPTTDA
jgi:hypothetical protein